MRFAIASLALVGCVTVDDNVLQQGPVLRSCADLGPAINDGQACDFADLCALPAPDDPRCCRLIAACDGGSLTMERYCDPGCATCMTDGECAFGAQVCDGNQCVACPDPMGCPPCSPPLAPLVRNGCVTCECAPPSECRNDPSDCPNEQCYPGMVCAPGCTSADCCANVCSAPGCPSPAPLGCMTNCGPGDMCTECVTTACECVMGTWDCQSVCGQTRTMCFQPSR